VAESLIARKKTRRKAGKKTAKKAGKSPAKKAAKKTAKKEAAKPESTKAKQKELAGFEAPRGFQFTAKISGRALEKCAEIDLLALKVQDAARNLTTVRKEHETAQDDLKKMVQGEDPTGTLFSSNSSNSNAEE